MSQTYIPVELRRLVISRADHRCEYCHIHEDDTYFGCEVDHVISEKHGGPTVAENLAYACLAKSSFATSVHYNESSGFRGALQVREVGEPPSITRDPMNQRCSTEGALTVPTITIEEAQAKLPEVIDNLTPGEELIIIQHGEPVAKLARTATKQWPCKAGSAKDSILWIAPDFDEPLEDFQDYME
jgi:antitoxin (DNA-binding transcriptional repressor) of toxin-antitoxin stability system